MRAMAPVTNKEWRALGRQLTLLLGACLLFSGVSIAAHGAEHALDDHGTHVDCTWCEHFDRSESAASAPAWPEALPLLASDGHSVFLGCHLAAGDVQQPRARAPPRSR